MHALSRSVAWFALPLLTGVCAGCAARSTAGEPEAPRAVFAEPPPGAAPYADEEASSGVAESASDDDRLAALEAALREDERRIELELALQTRAPLADEAPATAAPAPERAAGARPSEAAPPSAPQPSPKKSAAARSEASGCDVACRALSSMRRSAEGICELTSTSDARCTGARTRLENARTRVVRAGCPCSE
jgi:hypothetical protein